jgi:hypothetical protein
VYRALGPLNPFYFWQDQRVQGSGPPESSLFLAGPARTGLWAASILFISGRTSAYRALGPLSPLYFWQDRLYMFLGPTQHHFNGYRGLFLWGENCRFETLPAAFILFRG